MTEENMTDNATEVPTPADMPKQSPADEAQRGVPNGTPAPVKQSPADEAERGVANATPGSSLSASCEPVTPADEHTTFSREYVEELRGEAAKYRTRAKHTEQVERRLHDALVRLDGRLHDASDLDFDPKRLEGDGVEAAITALLEAKPHLAKRAPSGDVGAGVRGEVDAAPDLISIMRGM